MDDQGQITHLKPAAFHGNPISAEGSLVTMDWGFDICRHVFDACGLFSQLWYIDDISRGIRAEYIEILITFKPAGDAKPLDPFSRFVKRLKHPTSRLLPA